jgi:ABC transporter substrate binding protein
LDRRADTYRDTILKGLQPANLPVEEPSRFDCIINLTTVHALGRTISSAVLTQASQVIRNARQGRGWTDNQEGYQLLSLLSGVKRPDHHDRISWCRLVHGLINPLDRG